MRIFRYIPPDAIDSNVHVITVIEYVDKQEIHMTAKEMERLDEIRKWNIFVKLHESCIRLLYGNSIFHIIDLFVSPKRILNLITIILRTLFTLFYFIYITI